ncbi:SDR family oxidoreductase [Cereibacter sphaeroides]|uniref:SDR family oxidoreductase n=1 Tax=Cereibacter sphaeroides TaxID=1063 RepID=UPI002D7E2C02|nr:SDR family oxidoreductase [Cereibacter sphaeroides]
MLGRVELHAIAGRRRARMHRMGRPDEIASVVHFVASDASSLMTGTTVVADAGFTCW